MKNFLSIKMKIITIIIYLLFVSCHIKLIKSNKIKLIIPIISRDFEKIIISYNYIIKYLDCIKNIVLIGDKKIEKLIEIYQSHFKIPINFVNENSLIDINLIKQAIKSKNKNAIQRSGWYMQQFLKMEYSKICQEKYYLIWDSDTIPIKEIKMFDKNGNPYFDVTDRYYESYFVTMKKIFPQLGKIYKKSFVSEHMIVNTKIMKELINKIEINKNLYGSIWYEKVINCIDKKYLNNCGFSEFETYGTFVYIYYNNLYLIRDWKSLRNGKKFYNYKNLSLNFSKILQEKYDSISFEH